MSPDRPLVVRRPIGAGTGFAPTDVLRLLRDDEAPFALVGAWCSGGAVLGSEPVADCRSPDGLGRVFGPDGLGRVFGPDADRPADGTGGAEFGGGWVGWLGYGLAEARREAPPAPGEPRRLPVCSLAFYDHVLRAGPDGRWWFEALARPGREAALEERFDLLSDRLRSPSSPPARPFGLGELRSLPGPRQHEEAVAACVARIAGGDLSQANLCMRFEGRMEGAPLDLFCEAVRLLRPPYAAYVEGPDGAVVSLSPELFLRRRGRHVTSRPIKGTAARPAERARADEARRRLESSAKDRAENVMIVDLVRNDLGRVCVAGSVRVPRLCSAEPHPGVWHLVSEVTGTLGDGVGDEELLAATFPPGSITGAPKVRAMEVIHDLEAAPREVYTGAIGYRSPLAGLELNVAIRTFETSGGRVWLGAGGGVVADSSPAAELAECHAKAAPLVEALGGRLSSEPLPGLAALRPRPAAGIFTTTRLQGGVPWNLDAHLARLGLSCRTLYGKPLPPGVDDVVSAAIAADGAVVEGPGGRGGRGGGNGSGAGDRPLRLRVTVQPVGGPLRVAAELSEIPPFPPGAPTRLRAVALRGGLGGHKWADRRLLEHLRAAGDAGDVLLVCDEDGLALEAQAANVFAVVKGRLCTPPADGRLLPGIARRVVLEATAAVEAPLSLSDLEGASEVFLTNSLRGVVPVTGLAGRRRPVTWDAGEGAAAARRALARAGLHQAGA